MFFGKTSPILVQIGESALSAFGALRANKLRTFLSTLGITIGIFCIIAVLALVESMEVNLQQSVESLGKNVVFVEKWPWSFGPGYKWWKYMNRPNPTLTELKNIQEKSVNNDASMLTISLPNNLTAKAGNNNATGFDVQGVTFDFYKVRNFDLSNGRYFTESEMEKGENVCIVGAALAETLFPNINPIEHELKISGRGFKVIGVFKKEGESLIGNSLDNIIVIPVKAAAKYVRINSDYANSRIHVKANSAGTEMLEEELNGIMRAERKLRPGEEQDFALNKTTLISEPLKQTFKTVNVAGWFIGLFAMLVGGFGIANIMFVSVKERTNQIGIQKSLGAKNYFILIEFLVEAVVLCLFGGIIGLLLVWGIMAGISAMIDFHLFLSVKNVMTGILVSVGIGILSGFIPAFNASRLNPVDAIRSK